MALALAIFALALIGGMIGMNFLSALLEQQGGRNILMAGQLAEAADGALWELMPQVEPDRLLLLPAGGTPLDLGSVSPQAGRVIQRRIGRLADNLFLVRSRAVWEAPTGGELAARSAALLARLSIDSASGAQILLPIGSRPWLQLY